MKRSTSIMSLVVACVATVLVPAHATFPDQNGRIAFRRFLDADQTTGAVFTVRPNGTDGFQVTHPPRVSSTATLMSLLTASG